MAAGVRTVQYCDWLCIFVALSATCSVYGQGNSGVAGVAAIEYGSCCSDGHQQHGRCSTISLCRRHGCACHVLMVRGVLANVQRNHRVVVAQSLHNVVRHRRDFFGLCGRLLSVATEGLTANTGIFGIVLVQQLLVLCVSLPLIAGMGISWTNGDVVPNRACVEDACNTQQTQTSSSLPLHPLTAARSGRAGCYGDDGEEVVCCVWQPDTWVLPYLGITALGLVWSSFLAFAIRLFVIAGTVAQWYFAPTTLGYAGALA